MRMFSQVSSVSYYNDPLFDNDQVYEVMNEDGDIERHPTNVWGLHSFNKDISEMQEGELYRLHSGCSEYAHIRLL